MNALRQYNMNGQDQSAAHSALQYIISKALLEGKTGKTTIEIPMIDMFSEFEGPKFVPESAAIVLKLEIISSWAAGDSDGDFDMDVEGDIGLDEFAIEHDDESEDDSGQQ